MLEAAGYRAPVFFGPFHHKSVEVAALITAGGGFDAENPAWLIEKITSLLSETSLRNQAAIMAKDFVNNNTGATKLIMDYVQSSFL